MLHSHTHHLHLFHFPPTPSHRHPSPPSLTPPFSRPLTRVWAKPQKPWLAQLPDPVGPVEDGPIRLPPSPPSAVFFGNPNDASPIQVATSVLLTGAISVFLFRSLRRRAKRAKELRLRSTGVTSKKGLKEEALENLNAMRSASLEPGRPPSPAQALLGGISAGVIAIVLYKFTLTIEAALNRQTISDNFSRYILLGPLSVLLLWFPCLLLACPSFTVRQITLTIRTIVNGLCYLATFVFGANAVGLVLYSGQLAINSFMEDSTSKETSDIVDSETSEVNPSSTNPVDNAKSNSNDDRKSSEEAQ